MNMKNLGGSSASYYSKDTAGIPSNNQKWIINTNLNAVTTTLIIVDDSFYVGKTGDLQCISASNGEKKWELGSVDDGVEHYGENIVFHEGRFLFGWCVFNASNGELLLDLSKILKIDDPDDMEDDYANSYVNGCFYRYVEKINRVVRIHVHDLTVEPLSFDGHWRFLTTDITSSIVFAESETGEIGLLDLEKQEFSWKKKSPIECEKFSNSKIDDDSIYISSLEGIWNLDINTGEVIWSKSGKYIQQIFGDVVNAQILILSNDYLYVKALSCDFSLKTGQQLISLSKENGDLLWYKSDFYGFNGMVGEGDIIYGVDKDSVIAIDRYTGEKIWQPEITIGFPRNVLTSENRVYFTGLLGDICCYEWNEPYHSPAKL